MEDEEEKWREIAFSYSQIKDFLTLIALPPHKLNKIFPIGSLQLSCFCTGFYFFCYSIKQELNPELAEALMNLAIRIEAQGKGFDGNQWDIYSEQASQLLALYFG